MPPPPENDRLTTRPSLAQVWVVTQPIKETIEVESTSVPQDLSAQPSSQGPEALVPDHGNRQEPWKWYP